MRNDGPKHNSIFNFYFSVTSFPVRVPRIVDCSAAVGSATRPPPTRHPLPLFYLLSPPYPNTPHLSRLRCPYPVLMPTSCPTLCLCVHRCSAVSETRSAVPTPGFLLFASCLCPLPSPPPYLSLPRLLCLHDCKYSQYLQKGGQDARKEATETIRCYG